MKLSAWAKEQGIGYRTAWQWFHDGRLPVKSLQTASGAIFVYPTPETETKVVVYARVSSHDQSADLDRQVARLCVYCAENDLKVTRVVREVGSGLNGKRKKLAGVLAESSENVIVVEHKDRLVRWGFELIEASLSACGRKIIVVEDGEIEDDLAADVIAVLTSVCARVYGRRGAEMRARRATEKLVGDQSGAS